MKMTRGAEGLRRNWVLTPMFIVMVALAGQLANVAQAFTLAPGTNNPTYTPLDTFSFNDTNNWTSDAGYYPVSFTNLTASDLGDGSALVVNSTNVAWLQYNVAETNGATNLTVNAGSVTFWFAPAWSSTNQGGSGPGEWGRLLEVGGYTPDSSFGLWSLYVDEVGANIYFSAQTNDFSSNFCTYVTAPIAWNTNYWHFIAFTYSSTNTALYLDGVLATNGPPLTNYPGPLALANGFFVGSDSNGIYQAQGMIDDLETYSVPLDANTIAGTYFQSSFSYYGNIFNEANLFSATTTQTTFTLNNDVITGTGNLMAGTNVADCVDGTNLWDVWITNVFAKAAGSSNMTISFTIEGSSNSVPLVPFDVFANSVLQFGATNVPWAWEGQGFRCTNYTLTVPSATCFLILGTPQDSDHDGLTDAYEILVSKTNPYTNSTDGTGMYDGWEILYFGQVGVPPNGDPDGDGLTTDQEWLMNSQGYNPVHWHSFTNSMVGDGFQNYSGDGLANVMQAAFGGNMLNTNLTWNINTSGDGLSDEYKTLVGLSTNSAATVTGLPSYTQNPVP